MGDKESARAVVHKKLGKYSQYEKSIYWPNLYAGWVRDDVLARVENPTLIWQSESNLCGMATFMNALAWDDPYLYAYFVSEMFVSGAAYLGYGKDAPIVKASKLTRSSKNPFEMSHADWIALASVRDHLNDRLHYTYGMGVPGLKDIPLLGFLGTPNLIEAVGAIHWPGDTETILKAVGYKGVVNTANATAMPSPKTVGEANSLLTNGYRVLLLINTNMLVDDGGSVDGSMTADHWVRLTEKFEIKSNHFSSDHDSGIRFRMWNPQEGKSTVVPGYGGYLRYSGFMDNFYGFVAGKL